MARKCQRLWRDVLGTPKGANAVRALAEILTDKEGKTFISHLEREDAVLCIEVLDRGIAEGNLKTAEKLAFFVTLRRLSGNHGRLPESITITEKIEVSDKILGSGGFADVRCGRYMGRLVAVKTMRVTVLDDHLKIRKQFCKEVILWSTLSHPNVLKLIGVKGDMGKGHFTTVSEWMTRGNVVEYIKENSVNRLELLHGAAQGLEYLHGANLTHGDLKGANILVSNDAPPRACLADFGFMTVVFDPAQPMSCSAQLEGGTLAFMSPELLVPSKFGIGNSVPTKEADIYAFGLVIFQVLTGEIPFRGVRTTELGWTVSQGLRPVKPENASSIGFSDSLWGFVQRCWDGDMWLRPGVVEVVERLGKAVASWDRIMPPCVVIEDSGSEEEVSDPGKHGGIFPPSPGAAPKSPTETKITSGLFSHQSTLSTLDSDLPQEEFQETVAKPFNEPQSEGPKPPASTRPRSISNSTEQYGISRPSPRIVPEAEEGPTEGSQEYVTVFSKELEPVSPVPVQPQLKKPYDQPFGGHHVTNTHPYLNQYDPSSSQLHPKKRKGFKYIKTKFRQLFGFRR